MRLFVSFLLITLILPQTNSDNVIVGRLNDTGLFVNYSEAKSMTFILTWILLLSFFLLHIFLLYIQKNI